MAEILTSNQQLILAKVATDPWFSNQFYFSGGTALSAFYLKHRYSVDLDFFSDKKYDQLTVNNTLTQWGKDLDFTFDGLTRGNTQIFQIKFKDGDIVKMDVTYFPYPRIGKSDIHEGLQVDSFIDIATNKLMTVNQRTEVKDYVDLYFILQKHTIWDLFEGVRHKYRQDFDLLVTASDLMKVEKFDYLPKMIIPLEMETLKEFYRNLAKNLGLKAVTT